jgi:hypothetical protein
MMTNLSNDPTENNGQEEQFWEVCLEETSGEGRPEHVVLTAKDFWGDGRHDNDWEIQASADGCFNVTKMPTHFCGGAESLENITLAFLDARNILIRLLGKDGWYQWQAKPWQVEEIPEESKTSSENAQV